MNKEFLMKRCLTLAKRAIGNTSPNPMVGALLVKKGRVIGEDYHRRPGTPHAEALVLTKAGKDAKDATLFISLEPCCHKEKRTPPCTDVILKAGVKEVVVSMEDPNPLVSGRGIEILEKKGIMVDVGLLEPASKKLNEAYIKYITTKKPFVILKIAMTLDGKIATPEGESKWITGEKSRRLVHRIRGSVDAILTAIGTVKADNPLFTSRLAGFKNPIRIVIDPNVEIPDDFHVMKTPPRTIIVTKKENWKVKNRFKSNIDFIFYKNRLDMNWLLEELGRKEITSLMIEGGSSLTGYAIEEGIVDKAMFFIAPKIIGGKESFPAVGGKGYRKLSEAYHIHELEVKKVGQDILIEGYLKK